MRLRAGLAVLVLLLASGFSSRRDSREVQGAALNQFFQPHVEWWAGQKRPPRQQICRKVASHEYLASRKPELRGCVQDLPEGSDLVADFYENSELDGSHDRLPSGLEFKARFRRRECRGPTDAFVLSRVGFSNEGDFALVAVEHSWEGGAFYLVQRDAGGWVVRRTCAQWLA